MRVHALELTAFGPFAETQVVDFEPLNAAGVFLLTGQTGAGKTSILDAICFGLFGQVPGVRDKAKSYRSHHARPGVVPRVVLEVTVQGRRLRLTRSPAWSRPSQRARSGWVEEKARAVAEELVDGRWVPRSQRADEVGHLVSGLLGLNRDQFCQVVMLPQGDFQAFLRAGARERQHILETLFGTQRFQAVERWLAEHRRELGRRCRDQEEQLDRLAARVHEACSPAGAEGAGLSGGLPELAADDPRLLESVRRIVLAGAAEQRQARDRADDLGTRAKGAQHRLDEATTLAERQERHREARRQHAALLAMGDLALARRRRLDLARAAEPLLPLVALVDEARASYDAAVVALEGLALEGLALEGAVVDGALLLPSVTGSEDLREAAAEQLVDVAAGLVRRLSQLEALSDVAQDCARLSARIDDELAARVAVTEAMTTLREASLAAPGRLAELRAELERATDIVRTGADAVQRRTSALAALAAAREVEQCDALAEALEAKLLSARQEAVAAAELWLAARERHLAEMAAELAGLLRDGEGCPVCGSESHPSPAAPTDQHVSTDEEAALLARLEARRATVTRLEVERSVVLEQRAEALGRAAGLDCAAATAAAAAAAADADRATAAATMASAAQAELDALVGEVEARRSALAEADTEIATIDERLAQLRQRHQQQLTRLEAVGGADALHDARAATVESLAAVRALESAVRRRDEAKGRLAAADEQLRTALATASFASRDDVVAARLSAAEIAVEEARARAHEVDLVAWTRVLEEPALVAAAAAPEPDLPALAALARDSERAADAAGTSAAAADRRQARLDELVDAVARLLDALAPLRSARDLAEEVAGLCTGTSTDNATRTALSHYVLAARLSQVVAAANARLDGIAGGRYQLEHTMVKGAGDTRGGLGLVVRDTHTDRGRDPATLSGGETFYVSLSLALGLADVVTAEAGGAELSTLFVDEGFGTLDDDTRDEVLDELDALRSGGRSVGLVSHLSELRARCPAQLHVVATPRGSHCLPVRGA